MEPIPYRICVVDDDAHIRTLLQDLFSRRGHTVVCAANGYDAIVELECQPADMVMSDIQMPGMDGFELLAAVRDRWPATKRVLMTGGDIDEYLSIIREHQIGNILSKGADFRFEEVIRYIEMLLTGNVFGLAKVFKTSNIAFRTVRSGAAAKIVCREILDQCAVGERTYLEMAVNELLTNAIFHAVLQLTGTPREFWDDEFVLDEQRSISVSWAQDAGKTGISIEDPMGRLRKDEVLRWLDHRVRTSGHQIEHGRGLLLVRQIIDRFIINIDPGKRTECILLHYTDRSPEDGSKPILIHEL